MMGLVMETIRWNVTTGHQLKFHGLRTAVGFPFRKPLQRYSMGRAGTIEPKLDSLRAAANMWAFVGVKPAPTLRTRRPAVAFDKIEVVVTS